jgi:hypothetical protein
VGKTMTSAFDRIKKPWKAFWQKNKAGKLFAIAAISTLITLLSLWELLEYFDTEPIKGNAIPGLDELNQWAWIPLIIGAIFTIGGWLYYNDHSKKLKKYEELMATDSKAQFVRNIDEIEELAIDLGPDFEKRVIEKRSDFKVKTR